MTTTKRHELDQNKVAAQVTLQLDRCMDLHRSHIRYWNNNPRVDGLRRQALIETSRVEMQNSMFLALTRTIKVCVIEFAWNDFQLAYGTSEEDYEYSPVGKFKKLNDALRWFYKGGR